MSHRQSPVALFLPHWRGSVAAIAMPRSVPLIAKPRQCPPVADQHDSTFAAFTAYNPKGEAGSAFSEGGERMRPEKPEEHQSSPNNYDEIVELLEQGRISTAEAFRLLRDIEMGGQAMTTRNILPTPTQFNQLATLEEIMAELESLIGLAKVKKLVKELQAFIQIQKAREAQHLATEPMVLHMIFKGNPLSWLVKHYSAQGLHCLCNFCPQLCESKSKEIYIFALGIEGMACSYAELSYELAGSHVMKGGLACVKKIRSGCCLVRSGSRNVAANDCSGEDAISHSERNG